MASCSSCLAKYWNSASVSRDESPQLAHGGVVDRLAAGHFGGEVVGAEGADRDAAAAGQPLRPRLPLRQQIQRIDEPPGVQVAPLPQSPRLQQAGVVAAVVVHHDPRRRVEPFDQQAAGIVDRIVDRAADRGPAAGAKPAGGGVQQGVGRLAGRRRTRTCRSSRRSRRAAGCTADRR